MFKIFGFLKYAALIALFGILAVFSSLSFNDDVFVKERWQNNAVWKTVNSVIGALASAAADLGRANLESRIPLSSNVDVDAISKSFNEALDSGDVHISSDIENGNSAWADFFAKIKEEWAKTKLE